MTKQENEWLIKRANDLIGKKVKYSQSIKKRAKEYLFVNFIPGVGISENGGIVIFNNAFAYLKDETDNKEYKFSLKDVIEQNQ